MSERPSRIGERLVEAGLVTSGQVEAGLRAQRSGRGRLGYHLLAAGALSPEVLGAFLEEEIAARRLDDLPRAGADLVAALPARLAHVYNVYPISLERDHLELGVPPVLSAEILDAVGDAAGRPIEPRVVPAGRLREAVERDYLGAGAPTVVEPAVGLTTLVVEDPLRSVKPVAPALRTGELTSEAWLRSALAEAVSSGRRVMELVPGPVEARLVLGDDEASARPFELSRHARLARTLLDLARVATPEPGRVEVGRFQLLLRGRRPLGEVAARSTSHGLRLRVILADQRLASDDLDDLCEGHDDVRDGIDAALEANRGLVLLCSPAGGGAGRLLELLADRLRDAAPGCVRITAQPPGTVGAGWQRVLPAAGDLATAEAIHGALGSGEGLVVVDELSGARSVERALLVSSRRLVVAGLSVPDRAAALGWLCRHGFAGALKNDLLRAVLSVLAVEDACSCAARRPVPVELLQRWGLESAAETQVVWNEGCPRCVEVAAKRPRPVMTWSEGRGASADELARPDVRRSRVDDRERGRPSVLELAMERARPGGGGELRAVVRLLEREEC